jgi:signal transduction histidine kinase
VGRLPAARIKAPAGFLSLKPKRGDVRRSGIASGIYAAQIQALYQRIPMVLTVNAVNSVLVAIVLASRSGQIWWLLFLALTAGLTGARALAWAYYRGQAQPLHSTTKSAICAIIGSGLSGALWGASSAFLLPGNLVEETFIAFVIGGMSIASLVSFSNYLPAFIAYVFPASLPLAARFFYEGWTVHGDMMLVFTAAVTLAAYHSTRVFANGLQLNLDLTEKTNQLSAANTRLKLEIAQRKIAEDKLRQAHKMEAIGQLTGGVAHDFNNLLTAIIGHLELAENRVRDDPRMTALLQTALRSAERGAALTRHLLAFGRRQPLEPKPVNIVGAIASVAVILKQTLGPEIQLVMRPQPNLRPAWADPNQLELAILNLALNARDAMPTGGILRFDAERRPPQHDILPSDAGFDDYVVVSVSDTGIGMDQRTLEHAFEPFFTTKEAGRGSGLGLSIVHSFAAESGGYVHIRSAPDKGTRVDLWLPCAEREAIAGPAVAPDQPASEEHPRRTRVLVCDDDPDVLSFVGTALRDDGWTVCEAETPFRAIEMIETEPPFDLLLVDYAMPQMNGLTVINRARAWQRELRVLLMSGNASVIREGGAPGVPLLAKPFKVAELRKRVADALYLATTELGCND